MYINIGLKSICNLKIFLKKMTQAPNKVSTHYKKTQKNGRKPQTQYSIELWRPLVVLGKMDARLYSHPMNFIQNTSVFGNISFFGTYSSDDLAVFDENSRPDYIEVNHGKEMCYTEKCFKYSKIVLTYKFFAPRQARGPCSSEYKNVSTIARRAGILFCVYRACRDFSLYYES